MKKRPLLFVILIYLFAPVSVKAQIINTIAGGAATYCDGCPATSTSLGGPEAIAIDKHGNIYVVCNAYLTPDCYKIRKVSPAGIITAIAGIGVFGYSGDGGPATSAQISRVYDIATDSDCNIYFTDFDNNLIRRIDTSGIITTIAGSYGAGYDSADGRQATNVGLAGPRHIAIDKFGNIYCSEMVPTVRKINTTGIISKYVGIMCSSGYSGDGGQASVAQIGPAEKGLAVDTLGNLYVADYVNRVIRKVDTAGIISTFAGGDTCDADGIAATSARLEGWSVACNRTGNLYINTTQRTRKINNAGIITTIAGNLFSSLYHIGDGGPATAAFLWGFPISGIAIDKNNDIYVSGNGRVRKIYLSTASINDRSDISKNLRLYPNPTSTQITITSTDRITAVELYNPVGQLLLTPQTDNKTTVTVDVSILPSGLYYSRVNGNQMLSFIKE